MQIRRLPAKRIVLVFVLLALLALPAWYAVSFLPHLAAMKASSARGLAAAGDAERWRSAIAARETPKGMRTWAMRQSYIMARRQATRASEVSWHIQNLLWFGASYLHFSDQEILGIWIDCGVWGCGQGLDMASLHYLGKHLRNVSPHEMASLLAWVRRPDAIPVSDHQEIAAAVMHEMYTTVDSARLQVTITLDIAGSDSDLVRRYVMQSYRSGQRFIDDADRVESKHCWYDRATGLPSLGMGIDVVTFTGADTAEVKGGSAMCIMGMQESTFTLQYLRGHWKVVKIRLDAIV